MKGFRCIPIIRRKQFYLSQLDVYRHLKRQWSDFAEFSVV
jgi:hypothetical protein